MCDPDCRCLEEDDDDDDFNRRPRRWKKKSHKIEPCQQRPSLPPDDPDNTTPLPIYRKGLRLIQKDSYQEQFPPLEKHTDPQTKNARAQNSAFRTLDEKIERVVSQVKQTDTKVDKIITQLEQIYLNLQNQVSQLNSELRMMIQNRYWVQNSTKRKLKAKLDRIDADKEQPSLFAKSPTLPLHAPTFNTYQSFYTPSSSRQSVDYVKFFGLSRTLYRQTPTSAPPEQKPKPTKTDIIEPPPVYQQPPSIPDPQSLQKSTPEPEPKDKMPLHQSSSQVCSHLSELEDTSSDQESSNESSKESSLSSDSEADLADISKLLMVQPSTGSNDLSPSSHPLTTLIVEEAKSDTNPTAPSHDNPLKPSNGPWFTFDDIPKVKWPVRF
ncbi:hypothetical protein KPL70_017263 [Citrus sinensis]|nr:hypothetical protein KPL70_017263 [Citrus sinensis]